LADKGFFKSGFLHLDGGARKRQLIVINRCCFCKSDGETVDHLLLHCEVASALWSAFSVDLGCLELCLIMWLTCLHVGGRMSFLECYGVEDDPSLSYVVFVKGKKMRDILRILRGLWRSSSSFSSLPFSLGQLLI
jgi:hypothetical protein